MDAFDEYTGLPQRGAEITFALIVFSIAFLFIIFMFSLRSTVKHKALNGFENAFGTDPIAYPIAFSVIGAVWLGATVMYYKNLDMSWPLPATEMVFLILSGLSAVSIVLFAIEMYQDPRRKSKFALSIVPSLFSCYWLIIIYRENAANPVLLSYCYLCLAVIASALGFYFTSGFVYNKPAPGKAIFCYFSAVYFCFVTLADKHILSIKLIIIALIAVNTFYASMLIRNLQWKEEEEKEISS
jgi:energy-converting hydrogenase Eha subunit E